MQMYNISLLFLMFLIPHLNASLPNQEHKDGDKIRTIIDKATQTDESFNTQEIRSMTASQSTDVMMCQFVQTQLQALSKEASNNDYHSIRALQLFEEAMHKTYIEEGNYLESSEARRQAIKKLKSLELLNECRQVPMALRKALIAQGIYPQDCSQDEIRKAENEKDKREKDAATNFLKSKK